MASVSHQALLAVSAGRGAAALIDRTTGTNIGNGTVGGGLAAAFDAVTNQTDSSCAAKAAAAANSMFVGKTNAVPTAIESVTVYGSNNSGYVFSTNPACTLTLYGKMGVAPANGTDGTSLGSVSFTDTANESASPRTINSSDTATYWDHRWVNLTQANNAVIYIAEIQTTGWI